MVSVEPLNTLSVCDSMCTLFIGLINNGFRVKKCYSVELDPVSRGAIVTVCDVVSVSLGHDVMAITEEQTAGLATPECQPWGVHKKIHQDS